MSKARWIAFLLLSGGCASAEAQFSAGMSAFQQGRYQESIDTLAVFAHEHCFTIGSDQRCKEARVLASEAQLRIGNLRAAFLLAEKARWYDPESGPLADRINQVQERIHQEASRRFAGAPGAGRAVVRFESQTERRLRFLRVTVALDFRPFGFDAVRIDGKTVSATIGPTVLPTGDHSLDIVAVYEGTGTVRSVYRFTETRDLSFPIADGESVDVHIVVNEDPAWTSPQKVFRVVTDIRREAKLEHSEGSL